MKRHFIRTLALGIVALSAAPFAAALSVHEETLTPNPSGRAPLTALLSCTTDTPATSTLYIESPDGQTQEHPFDGAPATNHELMVLGLRPNRTHRVYAAFVDADGNRTQTSTHVVTTDPLPDNFPPVAVRVARPRRMEPGLTLVPFLRWAAGDPDREFGLVYAIDAQGEILWYYHVDHSVNDLVPLQNGNFAYQSDRDGRLIEIDRLGRVVRRWHSTGVPKDVPDESIPVETDTFHHDFQQIPNGNFLMLSTEVRHFDEYPARETKLDAPWEPTDVIGDVILEFEPSGSIVRQVRVFDLLDPYRIGYDSLGTGFYAQVYKDVLEKPAKDWSHTNGIFYDAATDSAILSSRHLDVVYKVDLESGELAWLLGNHEDWKQPWQSYLLKPVDEDMLWPYHQHAPKLTPHGTVLLYDNGNYRARPGQPKRPPDESFSRAVEFRVDEEAMTVEQVWSYGEGDDERFYSPFICDVDWLPRSGNVLITDGGRIKNKEGEPSANIFSGHHWARIVEVTHEQPARKVFEVVFEDPGTGWAVFRAERIPGLYP